MKHLDERVLEAAVAAALERIRTEQAHFQEQSPGDRTGLSLIETRLHHLIELIANGGRTDAVLDEELHGRSRKW